MIYAKLFVWIISFLYLCGVSIAEMPARLELPHYRTQNLRHELFYWQRQANNATAEVDYVLVRIFPLYAISVFQNLSEI